MYVHVNTSPSIVIAIILWKVHVHVYLLRFLQYSQIVHIVDFTSVHSTMAMPPTVFDVSRIPKCTTFLIVWPFGRWSLGMRLGNLHLEVGLVQATGLESMIYLGWELLCVAYITVLRMSQCISHFDLVPTLHSTF
jgi:hypothetical protein